MGFFIVILIAMDIKRSYFILCVAILFLSGACSKKSSELKDRSWETIIRDRYGSLAKQASLIFIVPEKVKDGRVGLLMLPTGSDEFNKFAPVAFMADEDGENIPPAANPPNNGNDARDNNANEDTTRNGEGAFVEGPSPEELYWEPTGPRPEQGPDEELTPEEEEAINEKLDRALDSAFNTKPDPDSIRLRIRVKPPIALPEWWKELDTDVTPEPKPDSLHLLGPDWWDVPFPGGKTPGWWPLNTPYPPDRFKLGEGFKPSDGGFKLGEWRIYIVPLPGDD